MEQRDGVDPTTALIHLATLGRRVRREPRMRTFASAGWTVFLYPLDVFESRGAAWHVLSTVTGFASHDIVILRSRRIKVDDGPIRTWWLFAVRNDRVGAALTEGAVRQSKLPIGADRPR